MDADPVRIAGHELLADDYYPLKKVTYDQRRRDGSWQRETREVYDSASGAAALLYDLARRTVVLTRQFRIGARLAGHDGYLIEVPAGVLDGKSPDERVRAELLEETGYRIERVDKVMELFASPGSLTERVHCFVAPYDPAMREHAGGGRRDEGEDIEVIELSFEDALARVASGEIVDAKTVVLLQYLQLHLA
ncbi:NUDIX domain-containing protein [Massilia solisilvae]|uniref:GDP-mannose pyrophosphatase n=1 Tax=Massilia solisilvae TaxID=1811225 RepID=A0ABT2BK66_9BURK|nr:NUDIX domain-containing protein [Massilia solisilvae]MCS0608894.1 NUDIX domain-containing protein [Massilia solisilvae]